MRKFPFIIKTPKRVFIIVRVEDLPVDNVYMGCTWERKLTTVEGTELLAYGLLFVQLSLGWNIKFRATAGKEPEIFTSNDRYDIPLNHKELLEWLDNEKNIYTGFEEL